MKKGKVIASIAVAVGFLSCTVTSRAPSGTLASDGSEFEGRNAPYYFHAEGIKAYTANKRPAEAIDYFGKAISADSTYAPAYYQIAEVLMAENPSQAVSYSVKANALDSLNLTYQSQLGRVLVMSQQYDQALDIYTRLMRDDPHNPINYRLLAALYDYKERPFTAISILDTAEMRLGRMEDLSTYKRELLMRVRLYDKAVEETNKLIADYPYDDENYLVLGELYSSKGEDSLALVNYREAMRLDSTNVNTLTSLADFYVKKNDARNYLATLKRLFESSNMPLESKRKIFEDITTDISFYRQNYFAINSLAATLITLYHGDYSVLELYATHLIRSGEVEQGLELYKSFLQVNPDLLEPYQQIIGIETFLMRPDSIAKYSDRALRRFPDNIDILISRGYAHVRQKSYKEAVKTFKDAYGKAESDSTRSVIAGSIGDTYQDQGGNRKWIAYYDKALRLDPTNAGILNNYAYYLGEEGKELEKALRMSERSNQLSLNNSTFLDTQAWILYKMERYDEARKIMQQAISFDRSNSAVLLFHYAEILYAQGDSFMAEVYWKRALERGYDPGTIVKRLQMIKK